MIGKPNTGKSSIINAIFEQKIVIVSDKPQTTWHQIRCIFTDSDRQIVFTDTPGLHKPVGPLSRYMTKVAASALEGCDVILWVFDADRGITQAEDYVYEKIQSVHSPVIGIVNKIDLANESKISRVLQDMKKYPTILKVIQTSATKSVGIPELLLQIVPFLKEGPFPYDPEKLIDKPARFIISELIREKIFRYMEEEIPYETGVFIEYLSEEQPGLLKVRAEIFVNKSSQKGMLIGKNAQMVRKIRLASKKDIEYMFDQKVDLQLYVRVKENWMSDRTLQTKELFFDSDS